MPRLVKVHNQFKYKCKKIEEYENKIANPHTIQLSDPLLSVTDYNTGNKH
jgi:hypothetical protein